MEFELTIMADLENLQKVREFIQTTASVVCKYEQFVYDFTLAVDEMVTNIIIHGYDGNPGMIHINARVTKLELEISICDHAIPFNPLLFPEPDIHRPLEERPIGGLGIYVAKILTDEMFYRRTIEGENELRLIKRCQNHA